MENLYEVRAERFYTSSHHQELEESHTDYQNLVTVAENEKAAAGKVIGYLSKRTRKDGWEINDVKELKANKDCLVLERRLEMFEELSDLTVVR